MAVAVIVDIPGGNQQVYEQLTARLFQDGKLPEGWQVHLAGPAADGWRIVNVVPSQEQFEAFAREKLFPAVQQAENVTPQLTFFPVYQADRGLNEQQPGPHEEQKCPARWTSTCSGLGKPIIGRRAPACSGSWTRHYGLGLARYLAAEGQQVAGLTQADAR